MLNARTLAQAPATGDTSGTDVSDSLSNEPLRPVEAFQTKEGVIVLSNRPADEAAPAAEHPASAPATPPAAQQPTAQQPAALQPAALQPAPVAVQEQAADAEGAALWLLLAALGVAVATVALLLVRRQRRRTTARYAALLAGSEPIAPIGADEHVGPFARRRTPLLPAASLPSSAGRAAPRAMMTPLPAGRTPLPATREERSSPSSAPPPSGISAPPTSERQWLSQPPPRSYKEPPS